MSFAFTGFLYLGLVNNFAAYGGLRRNEVFYMVTVACYDCCVTVFTIHVSGVFASVCDIRPSCQPVLIMMIKIMEFKR